MITLPNRAKPKSNPPDPEDTGLPTSAQNGRAGARLDSRAALASGDVSLANFNELVLAYQDAAYNFALYMTGDPDLAEDITQKAFISAYLNLDKFHGTSFRSWLFKIIKNASLDEFRSASYRRNRSMDAMQEEEEWRLLPADTAGPEQALEERERAALLQRALDRLDEPFRTILILVDIQELDYDEAAHAAGIPIGTVKSRLARARLKLRDQVQQLSIR